VTESRSNPREKVAEQHDSVEPGGRVPYPIQVCRPRVLRRTQVTPRMLRITVAGPELSRMHCYQCDDHVAIVLPEADGTFRAPVENDRKMLDWPKPHPPGRKYTIRRFDSGTMELDLDFVRHEGGRAAEWAEQATPGDEIVLAGPPGAKTFPHRRAHYVFVVDFTALPAAARWLEEAPERARTDLVVRVEDPTDQDYPLAPRGSDTVRYVGSDEEVMTMLAQGSTSPDTFVFVAGEAGLVRAVRNWSKERRLDVLATGYWKRGVTDFHDD
jgi:NADPH-dependent ferric siderophore reductase